MAAPALLHGGFGARWLQYFQERFPPAQYALALGVFTFAAFAYAAAIAGEAQFASPYRVSSAFLVTLLAFLQLRIHDEFKDFEVDAKYRPERPVPRGLVTLRSLGRLGWIAAGLQLALAAPLGGQALAMLIAILGYSWLMRAEFFCPAWLRRHALVYLVSHMAVVLLVALYVLSSTGLAIAPARAAPYLAFTYFNFCVFEIGRKIWAGDEERPGVETYSGLWGRGAAVAAWLAAMYAAATAGGIAAHGTGVLLSYAATAVTIAVAATAVGIAFVRGAAAIKAAWFAACSALWFLGAQLALGVAILWRP